MQMPDFVRLFAFLTMNNKRLQKLFSLIPDGIGFADIGTDHGYVPAELAANGYPGEIFACDINALPLENARRTAEAQNVSERIAFLLCNGISPELDGHVDCVLIAGMGGDTICGILDRAEFLYLPGVRFLLQPMSKAEVLRYWLYNNGFDIHEEHIVPENGTLYTMFCASFTGKNCSVSELSYYLGAERLHSDKKLYVQQREALCRRLKSSLAGLSRSDDASVQARYRYIQSLYSELEAAYET